MQESLMIPRALRIVAVIQLVSGLLAAAGIVYQVTQSRLILDFSVLGIPIYYGMLAVPLSFILCIVACRATGETDTTPIGALGKITQLTYGLLIPQNMTANLMTASITGNTATTSADLLTDLARRVLARLAPNQSSDVASGDRGGPRQP